MRARVIKTKTIINKIICRTFVTPLSLVFLKISRSVAAIEFNPFEEPLPESNKAITNDRPAIT